MSISTKTTLTCDRCKIVLEIVSGGESKADAWRVVVVSHVFQPGTGDLRVILCGDCFKKYILL